MVLESVEDNEVVVVESSDSSCCNTPNSSSSLDKPSLPAPTTTNEGEVTLLLDNPQADGASPPVKVVAVPPEDFVDENNLPPIPLNYMVATQGDVEKAKDMWITTLRWRRDNHVGQILQTPQCLFKVIKTLHPWYFHGKDLKGNVCVYQNLGHLKMHLLRANGITTDHLAQHNIWYQEYMWTVVMPNENEKVTLIFDLQGLTFRDVTHEVLQFIKSSLHMQSLHWPARTEKSFIVNAPSWFSYIFSLIKPLLNQRQREKVHIWDDSETAAGLARYIDPENIPLHYGGKSSLELGDHEIERQMWKHVERVLVEHNATFTELKQNVEEQQSSSWWW